PAQILSQGSFGPPPRFAPQAKTLVVHDVGDFEASFVPRVDDFDRLDPRFRLPRAALDAMAPYADWGFAVFKLRDVAPAPGFFGRLFGGAARATPKTIHPMAFDFPRRDPSSLFFPTLHIHDGHVHPTASFDHSLYAQAPAAPAGWETSVGPARDF